MKYLGLDISTYTGMTLYNSETEETVCKLIHFGKHARGLRRVQLIAQAVADFADEHQPSVAVIEGYAYGNTNTLVTLTELQAGIKLQLLRQLVPWYEVPPNVLKLWTTGKGNAKKPDMAKAVEQRWGYTSTSDDLVDAYALSRMGVPLHLKPEPEWQKRVVLVVNGA